jgi:predicted RNase H-like HicB family nuclease
MVTYPARFMADRRAGGYVVTFPDFAYGATQGESLAEATEMAQDLLAGLISDLVKDCKDLPKPSGHRSRQYRLVALPALQSAKVDLYMAFRASAL